MVNNFLRRVPLSRLILQRLHMFPGHNFMFLKVKTGKGWRVDIYMYKGVYADELLKER